MVYYTQLIFIKEGKEDVFQKFEDNVLPLLAKYNGKMLLRWRKTVGCEIETQMGSPYEVHFISFNSLDDFENYRDDKERVKYLPLKEESVVKAIMVEGRMM